MTQTAGAALEVMRSSFAFKHTASQSRGLAPQSIRGSHGVLSGRPGSGHEYDFNALTCGFE